LQQQGADPAPQLEIAMDSTKRYIRPDEHGVWRIGDTRVMLDSVLAAFHQGDSPETIRQDYPALSLEEVYGAIADYLANRAEIDDYLRRQDEVWARERARAEARPNPVRERLRKVRSEATPLK
jgi:uncharacterized protein (DUF433 family)